MDNRKKSQDNMEYADTYVPYVHQKHRTIAEDKAKAARSGKTLPPGYVPTVDMSPVHRFGVNDEVDLNNPNSLMSKEKRKRLDAEISLKINQKLAARKADEEFNATEQRKDQEQHAAVKRRRDDEEEDEQQRRAERQARKEAKRALTEADFVAKEARAQAISSALAGSSPKNRKTAAPKTRKSSSSTSAKPPSPTPTSNSAKEKQQPVSAVNSHRHLMLTDNVQDTAADTGDANADLKRLLFPDEDENIRAADGHRSASASGDEQEVAVDETPKEPTKGNAKGGCKDKSPPKRKHVSTSHKGSHDNNH